jgi:phosphomethylpyrimidine synthase
MQTMDPDCRMAKARKALDWKTQIDLSIDPERALKLRESRMPKESAVCAMCGELCAVKKAAKFL